MIRARLLLSTLLYGVCFGASALAQNQFQLLIQDENTLAPVNNGASVGVSTTDVGQPITVTISAIYRGNSIASITQAPTLLGSSAFTIVKSPPVPATLSPGASFSFDVRYTPTTSTSANALVSFPFQEAPPPGAPATAQPLSGFISLTLVGQAPEFVVSYFFPSNGNVIAAPSGSKLVFPPTAVNTSTSVTISVANRGSGSGQIKSISVTGSSFQPVNLPLLPGSIAANQELRFSIQYTPKEIETSAGLLTVAFQNRVVNIDLEGSSTRSNLSYVVLGPQGSTSVTPGQTISLPDTQLGQSSNVSIQVQNSGSSNGIINSINLTGTGFQLSNLPSTPKTLAPNEITAFTLSFAPTEAGKVSGRLLVGNDSFELASNAIGVRLVYSYTSGSSTITVPSTNGSVFFSPVTTGQTATTTFSVVNAGASPTTFSSIGIAESKSPFAVTDLPPLPVTLAPGGSIHFTLTYKPTGPGFVSGTLRLDGQTFTLSGSGTAAPPLPGFSFTGTSGAVTPLQQPAIGLSLSAPYSIPLKGTLTLSLSTTAFGDDPSVQFATGGTTVSFTIPANTTQAVFPGNAQQIRLQTGTVAGTISIKPSFAIGEVDITPDSAPSLQLTIPASAPQLFDLLVGSATASSLSLVITGISTTRTLSKLDFDFTPAPGFQASVKHFTIDVSAAGLSWFNSAQALPFGGQFSISISFGLIGNTKADSLIGIQSVSVTAANANGVSNPVTTNLR
jgi:hypothetical protein